MSLDLDRQLREYCQQMDEKQGVLSFDDILERSGEVQVIPGRRNRQPSPQRKWIVAVAAAFAVLLLVTGILLLPANDGTPDPADQPTTPPITAPTTLTPNADSIPLPVRGWPDTSENSAGVYSWDGSRCAGSSCNVGFMHNGYGSGDVEIRFDVASEGPITDDGATAVTVAGHDGTTDGSTLHRRSGP